MKLVNYFSLLSVICLISCQQITDNYWEKQDYKNYVSPYRGTYMGSYSGDDNGSLIIEISKHDNVSITKHSNIRNADDVFIDALNGSVFNGNASPNSGFRLLGNLTSQTKTFSGNWVQGNYKGSWTITKK